MRKLLLLLIPGTLAAQALQISPSTAAHGESGSFLIRLEAPSGGGPASLQWDLLVSRLVAVNLPDIFPGSSAESAGKSLSCLKGAEDRDAAAYRCILTGGGRSIPNGHVAIVKYMVPQNAKPGNAPVRIQKALGVSKDGAKIEFPNTQGEITIR